jgi:acyl-CoA reductase-like NAD-dependent aldehyde dehydrogenase
MPTERVAGADVSTAHFIDGKRVESKRTFEVCSPINGKRLADMSAGGATEIDQAVTGARRAFPEWAALGPEGRHPVLSRFAKAILDHAAELAAVETEDNGSLLIGNVARMVRVRRTIFSSSPIEHSSLTTRRSIHRKSSITFVSIPPESPRLSRLGTGRSC